MFYVIYVNARPNFVPWCLLVLLWKVACKTLIGRGLRYILYNIGDKKSHH